MKTRIIASTLAIVFAALVGSGCTYNHYSNHGGWHGGDYHHGYWHH